MAVHLEGPGPVVLVDDNIDSREIARHGFRLSRFPRELLVFSSGDGVITYLQELEESAVLPSLLLIDINMPTPDGLEVVRWIRARLRFRDVPLVILTSSNDERDMCAARDAGADSYQVKPFSLNELIGFFQGLVPVPL